MPAAPQHADWLRLDLVLPANAPPLRPRGRPARVRFIWYDTDDRALAARGQAVLELRSRGRTVWQVQSVGTADAPWPSMPGEAAQVIAEAAHLAALALDAAVAPIVQMDATVRALSPPGAAATAQLLEGDLRGDAGAQPVRRLLLSGPPAAVAAAALALGAAVPTQSLTGMAQALVAPDNPPARMPPLQPGMTVDAAFAQIVGQQSAIIVALAPAAAAGATVEPVHQLRVAIRRLRSAISLFGDRVACPELDEAKAELRALAQALGPARAWDVFLQETCAALASALLHDPAVAIVQTAASAQRESAYDLVRQALSASGFAALTVKLACLAAVRPWALGADTVGDFAAHALKRRSKRLRAAGRHIAALELVALHTLRLKTKRLRYAAEFFAPLYPGHATRRSLRALSSLQDKLGHLNDNATAEELLAELPSVVAQGYAGGLVRGFVAGGHTDGRAKIEAAWRHLRKQRLPWR